MTFRTAGTLVLAALLATGCDASASTSRDGAADEADEWGEDAVPATRDEILAAPAEHSTDQVTSALVDVAEYADESALPAVLALADDEREEVRWHVALALKAIDSDAAREALARLAADDPSELVRDEAGSR